MPPANPKRSPRDLLVPRPAPRDVTAAVGTGGSIPAPRSYELFGVAPEAKRVVSSGPGYTVMEDPYGRQFTAEGVRPWRNKNPGNIKTVTSFAREHGAIGEEDGYAVFPTEAAGMQALRTLLFQPDSKYRNMNPGEVVEKFAPPEDKNDTKAYQAFVNKQMGTAAPVRKLTPGQREALMNAIMRYEGYPRGGTIEMNKQKWTGRPQLPPPRK